jgi:uncharacterized protein
MNTLRSFMHACAVLSLLCLCIPALHAQQEGGEEGAGAGGMASGIAADPGHATIHVLARVTGEAVVLRFAPDAPHGWRLGNRIGYRIERRARDGARTLLTPVPLRAVDPATLEQQLQDSVRGRWLAIAMLAAWGDSTLAGEADSLGLDTLAEHNERNTLLFGMALFAADNDAAAADALGLRFVDRDAVRGETYVYTVSLAEPHAYRIDPGEVRVTVREDVSQSSPPRALEAEGRDRRIELRWLPPDGTVYTGFEVERADAATSAFLLLTATPLVQLRASDTAQEVPLAFVDTTAVNGQRYRYRVRGIDAFGMRGAGAEVEAMARDLTPPAVPIVSQPEQLGSDRLRLRWELQERAEDLAGFHILRGRASDSGFERVTREALAPTTREWIDAAPDERTPFYIVAAVDRDGNEGRSVPLYGLLVDTARPLPPRMLAGVMDTNGVVRLHWSPAGSRHLLGYRVLRANAPDHAFHLATGAILTDTTFVDTVVVRTLTPAVYYRVLSMSRAYRMSLAGAVLEVRRPDLVPPAAPVFHDVLVDAHRVRLAWHASDDEDVAVQVIERMSVRDTLWRELVRLAPRIEQHVDTTADIGVTCFYRISAVDAAGNVATSPMHAQARPFDSGVRDPVRDLTATYDSTAAGVTLAWRYDAAADASLYFVIYRSTPDRRLAPVASVPATERRYVDRDLGVMGPYSYRIKVMVRSGAESLLCAPVVVQVGR